MQDELELYAEELGDSIPQDMSLMSTSTVGSASSVSTGSCPASTAGTLTTMSSWSW